MGLVVGLLVGLTQQAPLKEKVQVEFVKVSPRTGSGIVRTAGIKRAIVLVHGLGLHLIHHEKAVTPYLRSWQREDSSLVRSLADSGDIYALCYGQNLPIDDLASSPEVIQPFARLKKAGYSQIIIVGHSAGGVLVRILVEDRPDLGITRVIQVCSPNGGSGWAALKTARAAQLPFLRSLSRGERQDQLDSRRGKTIPPSVQFVCVVGSCHMKGDGVVFSRSQWSQDLQLQGIPAVLHRTTHWDAMTNSRTPELIKKLVLDPLPRWSRDQVVEARKRLLGS